MALVQAFRRALAPVPLRTARFCATQQPLQTPTRPDVSSAQQKSGFDLGPVNAMNNVPNQGWQLATIVRQSKIPGAGNGRFAGQTLKAGSTVVQKPLMPMAQVESLKNLPNDTTITFARVEDLEKYIELSMSEGGYSREEILDYYEHFMYGFDGHVSCLNVSTWTVNHGDNVEDGLNVVVEEKELPGGAKALSGRALKDILLNEELYMDYRKFKLPDFYIEYTQKHGFKDVRTATLQAVYGVE